MKSTDTFFNEFSKEYEEQGRFELLFYRWMIKNIIRQIDKEKSKILDIGTGTGELAIKIAIKFPKSKVIGNDISEGMINEAMVKVNRMGIKNIKFIVSPVERLEVDRIDFAVSSVAFHHIKNKEYVISKICHALPKRGKLIIGDWFKPSKEYKREIEKLRIKNLERAKDFDESWRQFLKRMGKEYTKTHPKEYPICPNALKELMKKVGFKKQRIIKSLLPNFSVVIGEK